MKLGVQMDPIETIDIAGDTTFALMLEAQARGHELFVFEPKDVSYDSGRVTAAGRWVKVADTAGAHFAVLSSGTEELASLDAVLIRQDPPFDTAYLANTYLLELLSDRVVMLNSPRGIRNFSEKLRVLALNRFMAKTYIGRSLDEIRAFSAKLEQVVVKPLFLASGTNVIKTAARDAGFERAIDQMLRQAGKEPILVQEFIPQVRHGDKRVFVIDGEIAGVLGRVPAQGEFRANIHIGGSPKAETLTPEEEAVSREVARLLDAEGITFAGIDLIFGFLNEVNVTSPTLVREYFRLTGVDLAGRIIDSLERAAGDRPRP